jgi:hypothetical protein
MSEEVSGLYMRRRSLGGQRCLFATSRTVLTVGLYRVRHKSVNTPMPGAYDKPFVDKGVLTDLSLTLYFKFRTLFISH